MASKKPKTHQLVGAISGACNGPGPTVKNTESYSIYTTLKTKLNDANERHGEDFMRSLKFTSTPIPATGSSTRGDFSSDVYGSRYYHPNGAQVSISANFQFGAQFVVQLAATEEQAAEILKQINY